MNPKHFLWLLTATLLVHTPLAIAQQPKKIPRVGFVSPGDSPQYDFRFDAFLLGLRELGYVDGKNVIVEYRGADGKNERYPKLVAELVHLGVNIIVTATPAGVLAAKNASTAIPIVMAAGGDPVRAGLIASLAHPGGNVTGLTSLPEALSGKRLEILKEVVPHTTTVAVLKNREGGVDSLKETNGVARALGINFQLIELGDSDAVDKALLEKTPKHVDALVVLPSPMLVNRRTGIVQFAAGKKLPAIYPNSEYANAGGLVSYAANVSDLFRRAAIYVDKILKGAKPADLPLEQPTKFELVINLKTANQIRLTIPPNVLARADRVIR